VKDLAPQLGSVISLNMEMDDFGRLLHEGWMLKKVYLREPSFRILMGITKNI
jgi:hypothetical protein